MLFCFSLCLYGKFALLLFYTVFLVVQSRSQSQAARDEYAAEIQPAAAGGWDAKLPMQLLLIAGGLGLLVLVRLRKSSMQRLATKSASIP